ncbi:HIT family protein [Metasolibacillus sp. FSL H7-0170]|uniref:HIT family protein n=1 Tax=Metasolibacillus TaxID=2703677 RepID=UPI000791606E|nr:HIT family protein [Metasolibacillus fluoroglycofenilyticus]KYG90696.1 protein hit [[Bacillus] sp. KCTC 13219]
MSECLFCKIIDGSIPSIKVYEDEHVYAFMDIMPLTKGHTLLIPKKHCRDLFEMPEDVASHLYAAAPKVAKAIQSAFNPIGLNTVNNNGAAAGQTVFHYHLHFIPRYDETDGLRLVWTTTQPSKEELAEAAEAIREFI